MTEEMKKLRDRLAIEQGKRHANPIIRSMYPSTSRSQMSSQFAQLFSLGFDACYKEMQAQVEFLKMYFNPKDTSFKNMIETFSELSDEQKQALITLTEALLKTKEAK